MVDGMPVGCLFARPELDDHYGRVSIDADVHLFRDHLDRLRIRLAELIQHFFFALAAKKNAHNGLILVFGRAFRNELG